MNREIKFIFWCEESKQMSKVFDVMTDEPFFVNKPKNLIWRQYTGLKDKNEKEIYEGDILQFYDWGRENNQIIGKAKVVFDKNYMKFDFEMIEGFYVEDEDDRLLKQRYEIIGNIYENPELLEEKQ